MKLHSHTFHGHQIKEYDLVTLGIAAPLVALVIGMLLLPGLQMPGEAAAPPPAVPIDSEPMPYALHLQEPLSAAVHDPAATRPAAT